MCSIDGKNDPSEDEMFFEDDPRAEEYNGNEVGKVNIQSMGYVYTESAMASEIIDKIKIVRKKSK